MGRITSEARPLRPFAYLTLAVAAGLAIAGVFAPMTRGAIPAPPPHYHYIAPESIGESIGWSPVALPALLLLVLVIDLRRPGALRWAALLLGALVTVAGLGWAGIHWRAYGVDDTGYQPGDYVPYWYVRTGVGIALYAVGGVVMLAFGALAILRPRWLAADRA